MTPQDLVISILKKELIGLGAIVCKSDSAVFIWHNQSKVNGLLCAHIDDFLFGGTKIFLSKVINLIKRVFTIGSEQHWAAFKYLGLNISQSNSEIIIYQINYIKSVDYSAISNDKKKTERWLTVQRRKKLLGQLGWITGQRRPDLAFEVCQLSSILTHRKVDDILYF